MSSGVKCRNCGSTDIEEDNARGDRGKKSDELEKDIP